jgi:hypothetical protein
MGRGRVSARRKTLLFGLLLVLLAIPGQGFAAGGSSGNARAQGPAPSVKKGDGVVPHVFTGDLRDLKKNGKAKKRAAEFDEPEFGSEKQSTEPAPAVPQPTRDMPATSTSFEGLDYVGGGSSGWPPDPVGDVGPNHFIEAVNTAFAVYSKTGTQLAATTFDNFFSGTNTLCDDDNFGDPTVVYDPMADRWIVADFAFIYDQNTNTTPPPFYECIAVSRTSNPVSGGWYQYAVRTDDAQHPWLHDYPKMGIWPDGLYMSANEFNAAGNYQGVRLWAFNRGDLESGATLRSVVVDLGGGTSYFGLLPSNVRGALPPANSPNYLVSESETLYAFEVWKFHPDYTTPANTTFTGPTNVSQTQYTVAAANVPVPAPGAALDSLRERMMMQNQYVNRNGAESLWVNHTVGMVSTQLPTGIQWAQINVTGGTVNATPVQQQIYGNVANDGVSRWMGSLAVDKDGNMALGYSASSLTTFPDIRYAGRLASDPLNQLPQGEASLLGGVTRGVQVGIDRWGDYSAMTIDPDGCRFWHVNEYYSNASTSIWHTRIGSFKYPGCNVVVDPFINWAAQDTTDFNGDHITDLGALYRGLSPADSLWYAPGTFQIFFGATTDIPVPGDYNGDGKTDAVIFRPSTGLWYGPATGLPQIVIQQVVGQAGDVPIPGDYDGDGKTDPAYYRPSTQLFFAVLSGGGVKQSTFGAAGDVPVPRDYDGDGKTDFAIYRADANPQHLGLWYAPLSGGGVYQIFFGAPGDIPVPGDYDGDLKAEAVIFREATGLWYGPKSGGGLFQLLLGGSGDVPIPGYYDNNQVMDPAIYHKANGLWFALLSGGGTTQTTVGLPTDVPVQKRPALVGGL